MIISLIISLVIFIIFEICLSQVFKFYSQSLKGVQKISRNINNEKIKIIKESDIKEKQLEEIKEDLWQIEIPKINLIAPIAEGTSQEVMLEYVGHFENTAQWEGNIGLAAHNRGYPINYFSKLKELKNGDKVIYKSKGSGNINPLFGRFAAFLRSTTASTIIASAAHSAASKIT